jgi:hypothetical protein
MAYLGITGVIIPGVYALAGILVMQRAEPSQAVSFSLLYRH